ncbi:hypothetical protein MKW98_004027 [Papaver atlanticum]|uniref:Pentatricopeptide repeat-containing protein PNM1, mitochondrial n=1 Tax=Papaver atlanticum TaxID=357466 RepID=A0AAD4XLP7_9MAGN|nr:hypothetical protein MKW98_004027 [Papaver atlanticum]
MSRALQLGRYLRCISLTKTNLRCFLLVDQFSFSSSSSSSPTHSYRFLNNQPSLYNRRNFSSSTPPPPPPSSPPSNCNQNQETQKLAQGISTELLKQADDDSLPLNKRLDLHFSNLSTETPNLLLLLQVLNLSPDAGRTTVLGFHKWISSRPGFQHTDQTYSYLVDYFGRKKDFKIIHEILIDGRGVIGTKTLETFVNRLVRAGRDTQAVSFFDKMETEYGLVRNRQSLKIVVSNLCENGFANSAEKMVKNLAHEFFPDESTCEMLIKGWCVDGKLDQAKRLAGEIHRGGFQLGTSAYNSILDCVCKLCRKKDNFRLQSEAEKILVEMDYAGVPRNVETFNILINNLCKIRRTEESVKLFERMGEWGCSPNAETFLLLIKSLYQAARIGEGDEMIDKMKSAGFGSGLDRKAYFGFIKVLCGIERIEHAMKVFAKMKADGFVPGIKSYELLIEKLCSHGQTHRANHLSSEAKLKGILVDPKVYKLDPRFTKRPKVEKTAVKKRETLPEKMARKRKTLKKINLSFVKKPKKMMRRAY